MQVSLVYYFITLALNFFSRKIFIDYLGAEILGLNTTITNLLSFINLAELGIGAAISYSLYIPLFENDRQRIREIVSVQGWLYRRVALIVIVASAILIGFFPLLFAKESVSMWYAYATYVTMLFGSLLGYFVNYRQIVLTADQKDYKITINIKSYTVLKTILQIVAIIYLKNGYVYWLLLEIIASIIISFALNRLLRQEYSWLKTSVKEGYILRKKYSDIIVKTKQLFVHKMGGFALSQLSPLIIYALTSFTLVVIYGNYMLIIAGLAMLTNSLFNSITAGVGSLVAERNPQKTIDFFWQLAAFRFWYASIVCFAFYTLAHPFISVWVGKQYVLNQIPFILLTIYLFIAQTRVCDIFLNAYGLYKDIFAPIIEVILNVSLSILFGYFWGLSGVLMGVLISLFIIVILWKPVFLFRNAFNISSWNYFRHYLKYIIIIVCSFLFIHGFYQLFNINYYLNYFILLFVKIVSYIGCTTILFLLFEKDIKGFFLRLIKLKIKNKNG
jgi:O-antigen/teichoic acid export membrane protein